MIDYDVLLSIIVLVQLCNDAYLYFKMDVAGSIAILCNSINVLGTTYNFSGHQIFSGTRQNPFLEISSLTLEMFIHFDEKSQQKFLKCII